MRAEGWARCGDGREEKGRGKKRGGGNLYPLGFLKIWMGMEVGWGLVGWGGVGRGGKGEGGSGGIFNGAKKLKPNVGHTVLHGVDAEFLV